MDLAERLGIRIQYLRNQKGIRQDELASAANTTRTHISRLEHGSFNMRLETLEGICRGLRVQPAELFEGVYLEDL